MRITKSKEERRSELTDIASKLFAELGYDQVRVSDIVKEAKVAQGTLYYHFKTKEDVLYAVLERTIEGMADQLKGLASKEAIPLDQRFEIMMVNLFRPLDTDKAIFTLMEKTDKLVHYQLDELRRTLIAPIICDLIQAGIDAGVYRPIQNSQIISMIIFDGINEMMHRLYEENQSEERLSTTLGGIKELFKLILDVDFTFEG